MTRDALLGAAQRDRVIELAAARMTRGFLPQAAVALAADLLAEGVDSPHVLALAVLPADPAVLRDDEVAALFDEMCESLDVEVAVPGEAGWHRARSLASAIVAGTLPPGQGAANLWRLWEQCGSVPGSDPLDMLQLFEEWERSIGRAREQAEQRIVASAGSVIRDADRALAAMALPHGFVEGRLRSVDVMPLLLRACPSFLHDWYEMEEHHDDAGNEGGRLGYLGAGDFARHIIELHRQNNRPSVEAAFGVIERMHVEGDDYSGKSPRSGTSRECRTSPGTLTSTPPSSRATWGPKAPAGGVGPMPSGRASVRSWSPIDGEWSVGSEPS